LAWSYSLHLGCSALVLATLTPSSDAADPQVLRGRLSNVDPASRSLTVESAEGAITLTVSPDARLKMDGKPVGLEGLKPGRYLRISYREEEGARTVVSIAPAIVSDRELKKRVAAALDASKRFAHQQKDEYAAKMRGVVDDLDDRIDRLHVEMKDAGADAKKKLQTRIEDLKKRRGELAGRLDKLRSAAADAWEEVKAGFGAAANDLERALDDD
jgi:hypothetical protein